MDNILIRLSETDEHIIERASDRTFTSYAENGIISIDSLLVAIDDLVDEIDKLKEEISSLEQQMEEGGITDYYDYYGVSRNDF